jgi:hypothetical protein
MDRSRADRILAEWSAVADHARRPAAAPRPVTLRSGLSPATLGGGLIVALAIVVAVAWLGNRGPSGQVGGPGGTPTPASTPVVSATPTPRPTIAACTPNDLAARITLWEGAAGHRIAHVDMTRVGSAPCVLETAMRPQLVDGNGTILLDGTAPSTSGSLVFVSGERVTTLVDTSNYCGGTSPRPPVTIVFVEADGSRIVAAPASGDDVTVPPCNGAPGSAGHIEMHEWARP